MVCMTQFYDNLAVKKKKSYNDEQVIAWKGGSQQGRTKELFIRVETAYSVSRE